MIDDSFSDELDEAIVALVLQGEPNKVIGRRLKVPIGTIKWRLHRIYRRLGIFSRSQLIIKVKELNES